jgi:hypothetical protein
MCRHTRTWLCAIAASWVLLCPARAYCELGGDLRSVERDRAKMNATLTVTPMGRYTVHEMMSESGARVREFEAPGGRVFAVTWQGSFPPDFQQLLGPYFADLQQAAGARRARRAPVFIETPGFVFQTFGHFRDLGGRAYVPGLLPAGVSAEDLQ